MAGMINWGEAVYSIFRIVAGIVKTLSEGTTPHRVLEGMAILASLLVIFILLVLFPQLSHFLSIIAGIVSIYGSQHLRRCRSLYQGYLWGVRSSGAGLGGFGIYVTIIRAIVAVEILMIAGGAYLLASGLLGFGPLIPVSALVFALVASFGAVAVIGHITRVRLYRLFMIGARDIGG